MVSAADASDTDPASPAIPLEDEVESTTAACLRNAETLPLEMLHCNVNKNWAACEKLAALATPRRERIKALRKKTQNELAQTCEGGNAQTLLGEFLGSLGLLSTSQESSAQSLPLVPAPQSSDGLSGTWQYPQENLFDIDAALDHINHGPSRIDRDATVLLSELEALRLRFLALRAMLPNLREKIEVAYKQGKPLQIKDLKRTLGEACSWRARMKDVLAKADDIARCFEDFLEQCEEHREERLRWRAKTNDALIGLNKPIAARISALSWLRRARTVLAQISTNPGSVDTQFEEVCSHATVCLKMNEEAAELAQRQLVKCIRAVMRVETEHVIVTKGVKRLSNLKMRLLEGADALAVASDRLMNAMSIGPNVAKISCFKATVAALIGLLEMLDDVFEVLMECPPEAQEGGVTIELSSTNAESLRAWVRNKLLVDDDDYEGF